jgi:hypothetical protein
MTESAHEHWHLDIGKTRPCRSIAIEGTVQSVLQRVSGPTSQPGCGRRQMSDEPGKIVPQGLACESLVWGGSHDIAERMAECSRQPHFLHLPRLRRHKVTGNRNEAHRSDRPPSGRCPWQNQKAPRKRDVGRDALRRIAGCCRNRTCRSWPRARHTTTERRSRRRFAACLRARTRRTFPTAIRPKIVRCPAY